MRHTLIILTRDERIHWFNDRGAFQALIKIGNCAQKAHRILQQAVNGDRFSIAWTLSAMGELDS